MPHTTQDRGSRLLELGRQEEPGVVPGLSCQTCGRELLVSSFQKSFLLICRCGYQISPDKSSGAAPASLSAALKSLLLAWEQRLASLQALSKDARSDGFPGFSAVMERHIHNLHSRIEQLKRFSEPPSGRYFPPPAI
jgi:hypothetical protein